MSITHALPITESKPHFKHSAWGLPGGRVDFTDHPEITVRVAIFNGQNQLLLCLENPKLIIPNRPFQQTYREYLDSLKSTVTQLRKRGNPLTWAEAKKVVEIYAPEIDAPFFDDCWNKKYTKKKILLTAIKEVLEETGYLIKPKLRERIQLQNNHRMTAILTGIIVGGALLLQETQEIKLCRWFSQKNLPDIRGGSLDRGDGHFMYTTHHNRYLQIVLDSLKKKQNRPAV